MTVDDGRESSIIHRNLAVLLSAILRWKRYVKQVDGLASEYIWFSIPPEVFNY